MASNRFAGSSGVLPPRVMLTINGTSFSSRAIFSSSASDSAASTKAASAPSFTNARARERVLDSMDGARVRARNDDKIRVAPRVERGADFVFHLRLRNDFLAVEMAAALGRHLVLDVDRGDAGALEFAHRAHDAERVAVARIGVGDDRYLHGARHLARALDHLRHRHEPEIGQRGAARDGAAGEID